MRQGRAKYFLILPLLLSSSVIAGEIKGVVRDSKTNKPLADTSVAAVSDSGQGIGMTDANGNYTISNLPAGNYTVQVAGSDPKSAKQANVSETGSFDLTFAVSIAGETVEITGTRIVRPNLDGAVPVSTVTAAELMSGGEVSMGDAVSLLPTFRPTFTTQNSGRFIGTAGISPLDLRGMGTARTLVLQNGRRHVTSLPGESWVDVNTIPNDLLERVDVVTGGNSAVYGSDAIAGVVNFVTKRNYEGLGARAQTGLSSRGDRPTYQASLTAGTNFDNGRGNIAGSAEFAKSEPLYYRDREELTGAVNGRTQWQATQDTTGEPPEGDGIFDTTLISGIKNIGVSTGGAYTSSCTGTDPARRALNCSGVFNRAGAQLGRVFVFTPDGRLVENGVERDFRAFGSGNSKGGLGSTLRETGLLQTGNTRYGFNVLGSYELADAFRPFLEAKYVRTESLQEGQPTFSSGPLSPNFRLDNPFLTQQARDLLTTSLAPGATTFRTTRFNIDFSGRGENHIRNLYRFVAGADGKFLDTWRYEAAFNYGRVTTFYTTRGNVSLDRFTNAVNAVRNTQGNIVCSINNDVDTTNDDPNCAPLNVFGLGAPSAAALNYIRHDSSRDEYAQQMDATGFIAGDLGMLFSLPGGPVAFSLGGEWRQESSFSSFDQYTREGNTFLNAIDDFNPPLLNIYEGFGELRIPVLKDLPFAKELTVEAAGRISTYGTGSTGTVFTNNIGAIYSPIQDVRLRGSYARAIRAPTQGDLYSSPSETFLNGLADPCGQQNILNNPNRVANCAAAGVPTTQTFSADLTVPNPVYTTEPFTNRPASGILGLSGGNEDLTAEKSDSFTVGAIIRPSIVPGLTISIDYYNIDLTNAIFTLGAQTIINQCYDSPDGIDNQFCRAITRNPNGTFAGQSNVLHGGNTVDFDRTGTSFLQGPFNFARQNTSGIDTDISYETTFGDDWRFNTRAIIVYLINRDNYTSITEPDRRSQQKLNVGDPEWNGQLRLNLGFKDLDVGWSMRYVGQMAVFGFTSQNSVQGRPPTNLDAGPRVWTPEILYNDVKVGLKVRSIDTSFYVGMDNIFDQMPPFGTLGTGLDALYTTTGRFLYIGANYGF